MKHRQRPNDPYFHKKQQKRTQSNAKKYQTERTQQELKTQRLLTDFATDNRRGNAK